MTCDWLKNEFQLKYFLFTDCGPERFYKSQWSKNRWLFWGIKLLMTIYWFSWFVVSLVESSNLNEVDRWWIFLSNWGVSTLTVYFIVSFGVVTYGLTEHSTPVSDLKIQSVSAAVEDQEPANTSTLNITDKELRWFHKILWTLQIAFTAEAVVITVVYWTLLTISIRAVSINNHIINSVIMLLDLFLNDIPVRMLHFVYILLYGILYVVFSLVLHWSDYESAIYTVVDWETQPGTTAGFVAILVFVACPIAHFVIYGLYRLRIYIAKKVGVISSPSDAQITVKPTIESGNYNPTFQE